MSLRPLVGPCVVALALTAAAGCGRPGRTARGLVLITLDTTRADRLGCYGYPAAETPHLDAFASEAVRFEQAAAPAPTTLPSHASMFTGRYPPAHGVRYNGMFRLPEGALTVAEMLREAGWETGAIPAAFPVARKTGIAQGFAHYDDVFGRPGDPKSPPKLERRGDEVTQAALGWLERVKGGKFFLWVHYYDPHFPYDPPFPYSSRFRQRPYDGEVAYMDREIGKVFDYLRGAGLWDSLLVVVVGDHGEGLYDHGEMTHSSLAYETTLRVPLILKPPGRSRGLVVSEPVSVVDLGPTLLDFAQIAPPPTMDGISLRAAVAGRRPPRRALYFESLVGSLVHGWSPLEGVRRGRWKLIRSTSPELYDLDTDPGETSNVYASEGQLARDLEALLQSELDRLRQDGSGSEAVATPLDPEELERLASLGYIGGTVGAERRGGPSPRDLIHLEADIIRARELTNQRDYAAALEGWRRVLRTDPANRYALLNAASTATRVGRLDEAHGYARELTSRYPEFLPGAIVLGEIQVARRDFAAAAAAFREGLERHPANPALTYRLSLALIGSGDVREASRLVDSSLERREEVARFLVVQALCRARLGDPSGARQSLDAAIASGYGDREVLETEPMLEPLRAIPGFREALDAIPKA